MLYKHGVWRNKKFATAAGKTYWLWDAKLDLVLSSVAWPPYSAS